MINVNVADQLLGQRIVRCQSETIPLDQSHGLRLTQDLVADRDYPPFNRVAMDGYALSFAAWEAGQRRFFVEDVQTAGQPAKVLRDPRAAIEIMTGAKLPDGLDLVIRYEDTVRDGAHMVVADDLSLSPYTNIHRQGVDAEAGKSYPARSMSPPLAAIAASFGLANLKVARKARVAMIGTGDELVSISARPLDYQIRESNIHAVEMALKSRGHSVTARILKDQRDQIAHSVRDALEVHDILLLSGGVSAGKTDFIPEILEEAGVEKIFHRIAQKPGKPLWFGQTAQGKTVFGLPGNPVSTLICLYRYVLPFLAACEDGGMTNFAGPYVELRSARPKAMKLTHFVPVRIEYTDKAQIVGFSAEHNGSGDFLSLAGTDGFVEIPGESEPDFDPSQRIFKYYSWT